MLGLDGRCVWLVCVVAKEERGGGWRDWGVCGRVRRRELEDKEEKGRQNMGRIWSPWLKGGLNKLLMRLSKEEDNKEEHEEENGGQDTGMGAYFILCEGRGLGSGERQPPPRREGHQQHLLASTPYPHFLPAH